MRMKRKGCVALWGIIAGAERVEKTVAAMARLCPHRSLVTGVRENIIGGTHRLAGVVDPV